MGVLQIAEQLNKICKEHTDWYEEDILLIEPKEKVTHLDEDPIELARYGIHLNGHMDEILMEDEEDGQVRD